MLQHAPIMEPVQEGSLIPEQAFLTDDSEAVLRFATDALKDGLAAARFVLRLCVRRLCGIRRRL